MVVRISTQYTPSVVPSDRRNPSSPVGRSASHSVPTLTFRPAVLSSSTVPVTGSADVGAAEASTTAATTPTAPAPLRTKVNLPVMPLLVVGAGHT
jgi:hypothetical protein